jgi:uncharacterized protein (DUF1778 family)
MIKSLRLDADLANQVKKAARLKGVTESRFMRDVIAEEARATIERASLSVWDQIADLADLEGTGEQVAAEPHAAFERILSERHGHSS